MLKRPLALVFCLLASVCLADEEPGEGLAERCFSMHAAQILNNYQYCERDGKRPNEGRFDCVSQHWSQDADGTYRSKHFGWVTLQAGKRQGPAELLFDTYYLDASVSEEKEQRLKLVFQDDALEGTIQIVHPKSKARCEIPFRKGSVSGVVRVLNARGQLLAAREVDEAKLRTGTHRMPFEIRFCKNGKLAALQCATESKLAEDVGPCGFGARAAVESVLHSCWKGERTQTYWVKEGRIVKKLEPTTEVRNSTSAFADTSLDADDEGDEALSDEGAEPHSTKTPTMTTVYDPPIAFGEPPVLEKVEVRYASGKPMLRYQTKRQLPVEHLEYFGKNGKLLAEARFKGDQGEMIQYAEYFLNGQPKIVAKSAGKRGETDVLESSVEASDRVEECRYVDAPETAGYGYDYDRRRLRIDLSRFGIHSTYLLEPRECRVLVQREVVATTRYLNGLPHGEHIEIDPQAQTKTISTYEKGRLKKVKTTRLGADEDVLEEYRVLEDGSREPLKRQARKRI